MITIQNTLTLQLYNFEMESDARYYIYPIITSASEHEF